MPKDISPQARLLLTKKLFQLIRHDPIELSEELLTNDHAVELLCEALNHSLPRMRSHVRQLLDPVYLERSGYDPRLLAPRVTAFCSFFCTSGRKRVKDFDVTLWFVLASEAELRILRDGDYGRDEVAESVAELAAAYHAEVQAMFDSIALLQINGEQGDFECHVNQEEADAWLAAHRPHMLREGE